MLILTSDGLTTDTLLEKFRQCLEPQFRNAAIITTATNPFGAKHPDLDRNIALMERFGLAPDCVDIESQDPALLLDYDVIVVMGGNPYYLLDVMQRRKCKPLFEELLVAGKVIVGMSAGSMVLGATIDFVNLLTPEMDPGMEDYSGLALVDRVICPHASTFVAGIEGSEEKLVGYERESGRRITRINDGEAVFV